MDPGQDKRLLARHTNSLKFSNHLWAPMTMGPYVYGLVWLWAPMAMDPYGYRLPGQ